MKALRVHGDVEVIFWSCLPSSKEGCRYFDTSIVQIRILLCHKARFLNLISQSLEPDGALTFELPLPNPERQETFSRFVNGLKAAMATPESLSNPNQAPGMFLLSSVLSCVICLVLSVRLGHFAISPHLLTVILRRVRLNFF